MGSRLVRDVIAARKPISLPQNASVAEAAQLMRQTNIGALIVTHQGRLKGVFTERDALQRVLAAGMDPVTTPLFQVMTAGVITINADAALSRVLCIMYENNIRHLPVVDRDGLPIGMISIRDTLDAGWLANCADRDNS